MLLTATETLNMDFLFMGSFLFQEVERKAMNFHTVVPKYATALMDEYLVYRHNGHQL